MARRNEKGFHWQASKDEISLIYSPDEPFYRPPIGSKESFRAFVAFVSFIFFFYSPYPLLPRHLSFPNNGAIRFHQAINRGEGIKYSIGRIYIYTHDFSPLLFPFFFFIPSGVDSTTPWLRSRDRHCTNTYTRTYIRTSLTAMLDEKQNLFPDETSCR